MNINYAKLAEFCEAYKVNYNVLCMYVHEALAAAPQPPAEAAGKLVPVLIVDHGGGSHEDVIRVLTSGTRLYAAPQPPSGGEAAFKERVADMLPRGTTISDPEVVAERLMRAYEASFTAPPSAPVGVDAAKHWHDLYRKECQLRQDDAARYGQQIVDLEALAQQPAAVHAPCAAVAAIQFALNDPEGMTFLRLWNEGEFETLRREWPEAPSSIYIGADPLTEQPAAVHEAMVDRACDAYVQIADDCMGLVRRKAMAAALTAALAAQPGGSDNDR